MAYRRGVPIWRVSTLTYQHGVSIHSRRLVEFTCLHVGLLSSLINTAYQYVHERKRERGGREAFRARESPVLLDVRQAEGIDIY